MNYNMILAVAAIVALFISISSLIITAISIKKQAEHNRDSIRQQETHNKNSLRPICSIYHTIYENFISVRLENGGTGPLKIKEVRFSYGDGHIYQSLFDLFKIKNIDITQMDIHRMFPGIDTYNYVLPPNKKMYLLSVSPKSEDTTEKLRDLLKEITVQVKFSDIYEEEYECERKLASFGSGYTGIYINDVEKYNLWC